MNGLNMFLTKKYLNLNNIVNNNFRPKLSYSKNIPDRFYNMSVAITPQGIMTEQSPQESIDDLDDKLKDMHPDYRDITKERFLVGHDIASIYNNWINSYEGKEYVNYAKAKGKGNNRPGVVDYIDTIAVGEGLVAATTPDSSDKKIYINKDYIYEYASMVSNSLGLTMTQAIEIALIHELSHNDIQGPYDRMGSERDVEYNNDHSLVDFYTGLAKKDMTNSDTYLKKAQALTSRYDGTYRKTLDEMIFKTQEDVSESYEKFYNDYYRNAA